MKKLKAKNGVWWKIKNGSNDFLIMKPINNRKDKHEIMSGEHNNRNEPSQSAEFFNLR